MLNNTDRARDALHSIPPDCDRAAWVKTGMAYHAAGGDFDTFDQWSAPAGNYNAQACKATWRSFKAAPGGVGAGALFGMARDHGWREDGQAMDVSQLLRKPAPERATRQPEPPRKPAPGMSASEVYNRCQPASIDHPYLIAKRADPNTPLEALRVVPDGDPLQQSGESWAGALVVPIVRPDGTFSGLQLIAPPDLAARLKAKGKKAKQNLYGSTVEGWFTVGNIETGQTVYIVEGIGQAWACWQATGAAAVVCFGAGNMGKVATALRQNDDAARLVLVPDVGKESDAAKIAAAVSGMVAAMPDGWPQNSDVSDFLAQHDPMALEALLQAASEPPKPPPLLKPVSVFDVLTNPAPPPAFVWDGYLPRGVVALMGAHGGTGKSTIALMLGVCAALGRPLFGVDTEPCKTVFVSLEDGANIVRHRLAGICRAWGIDPMALHGRLHIVDGTEHPELFAAETRGAGETTATYFELRRLVQLEGVGLVVVDNASDAYGGDEIQRRQVRAFMRALVEVARLTNCAVMLLAHVDKATSRNKKAEGGEGYSGSTAWHNSARSRLFLTRGDDGLLTLEHQKSNLGKCRDPLALEWPDGGLPQLVQGAVFDAEGFNMRQQGRADDGRAVAVLKLIAEFESREQYCSPAVQARNNVHAMLKSEPAFLNLKLRPDDTKRIVNQCQRAKWLEQLDYRSIDRKPRQRWVLTAEGRSFAGLPAAPTAPTAPTYDDGAQGANSSIGGAPTAPTYAGGTGEERTHFNPDVSASAGGCYD